MMRKPIKTTEYRKMPAVRGFYGFKRKTLWRRYRFSLPFFFFFFILFIAYAARGWIGKYNKTWSVSLLFLLARIAWIENRVAIFATQNEANCKKRDVLDYKFFTKHTRIISWSKFYLFVSFFFSLPNSTLKSVYGVEISAMLWLFN